MSIPTPPDLAEGRITWTVGRGSSRALAAGRGLVRFRPSAVAANFSTASALLEPVETPVIAGVMTPVSLIQNDPEVWNWIVEPLVGVQWEPFPIDVDGPVDLATAAVTPGKGPIRTVKGETGYSLTGEVRYEKGKVEFGIEDGSWTDPVTMPPGPPGPSNRLLIGTVDTSAAGAPAEASISGESPTQYLNLTLPRGEKPAITWQGSTIVVDGVPVQDLRGPKGDASTEPGPPNVLRIESVTTGPAGSQASASITGASPEQALALTIPRGETGPRGPAGNVKVDRPAPGVWDFQPEALDVQVSDVQGLAARLAALEYDSGWRDVTSLLRPGLSKSATNGRCNIKRVGNRLLVDMHLTVSESSVTTILTLPHEWRPDVALLVPFSVYTVAVADHALPPSHGLGYLGASGASLAMRDHLPNPGTVMFYADFVITRPIPTTLPGTPA